MDMVGIWKVGLIARSVHKLPLQLSSPGIHQGKGRGRAAIDNSEVGGESGSTGHLDLLNNPMAGDDGDVDER